MSAVEAISFSLSPHMTGLTFCAASILSEGIRKVRLFACVCSKGVREIASPSPRSLQVASLMTFFAAFFIEGRRHWRDETF